MGLSNVRSLDSHLQDDLLRRIKWITIVDDDELMTALWKVYSSRICPNARVRCFTDPIVALQEITKSNFWSLEVLVSDLNILPSFSWIDLCRETRKQIVDIWIIMITWSNKDYELTLAEQVSHVIAQKWRILLPDFRNFILQCLQTNPAFNIE